MDQPIEVRGREGLQRFCAAAGFPRLNAETVSRQHPEGQWLLVDPQGNVAGRCSLWWDRTPALPGQRLGLIGHYAARDAEAGIQLLRLACEELAGRGCTLAVGPLDGNTWQNYRFITERGTQPAFFLEPDHPDDWPAHFAELGFTPLAHFYSALNEDVGRQDPAVAELAARTESLGIRVRPLCLANLEEELRRIHTLSHLSFRDNFLFTPIGINEFLAQYLALRSYVRPELMLIAEQGGTTVGNIFAVPDFLQAKRGQVLDTFIIKTLAVHPDLKGVGLGRLLAARCHEAARQRGFRRAIHALMEEDSRARDISNHIARPMRRYALLARSLGARP